MNHLLPGLFVALAACGTGASDHDTLDNVPRAAAETLRAQAGSATIRHVSRETSRGGERYEASWWEGDLEREAKVTADGKLVELEVEVRGADVPGPVRDAATRTLVGATQIKFVKLLDGTYEAEARIGGREADVTVTAAGQIVSGDGDDDDDDDGDDGEEDDDHDGDHDGEGAPH